MQQLIDKQRRGGLRGDTFGANEAAFGGFNYAGGSPSMNIPTAPSAQSTMAGIGQRALEDTSVADAIARGGNQAALGYAETLEDAQRQAIQREMAREQQNLDRFGGGVISGSTSAGDKEREAARRGLMRDFQGQQEKYALAEAQQKQRAMEYALGLEAQGATLDIQRELQLKLRELQAADKQADRELQKDLLSVRIEHEKNMDSAQGGRQMQIAEMNRTIAENRIKHEYTMHKQNLKYQIRKTQEAYAQQNMMPTFGGTVSNVSPGAESGMNPASRYANWS